MSKLVDQIKTMTVMELVTAIKEIEKEFGVSASAPVAVAAPAAAAAAAPAEEKSEFKITMKDSGADKIKVIKALRTVMTGLSLKDAKDMTEALPSIVAQAAPKEEAKKIKEALEAAGAKVELS